MRTTTTALYYVELAPGCYGGAFAPIISTHRTWAAAKRKAHKCDRLVAVNEATGERYIIAPQGDARLGAGRYGRGRLMSRRLA
jgi:hypothetical protein